MSISDKLRPWALGAIILMHGSVSAFAWRTAAALAGVTNGAVSHVEIEMVAKVTIEGELGSTNDIEATEVFGNTNVWTRVATIVLTNNPQVFIDTVSSPNRQRYYRTVAHGETHPPAPPDFVWLPAGTFMMGSPPSEVDREADEGPQTQVTFRNGFFLCQHTVTQAEYESLMGFNPSLFKGDSQRPVDRVGWHDAAYYCARLTEVERAAARLPAGWAYRLPTEAEWEYACRAGTSTRFSYGDDPDYAELTNYAWYAGNSGMMTHPVDQKRANPWGLFDMHGNVWEWCLDYYSSSLPGGSVVDPMGPATGTNRVIRGGCWYNLNYFCRSANRHGEDTTHQLEFFGFRVALVRIP
jgi:formylglycine-generating enzyme required for sulfatase activity